MRRSVRLGSWSRAGLLCCAIAGLGACGSTPAVVKEPEPCELQMVTVAVIAAPRINPTDGGEPRPVQLRLYQLKNDVRLLNASFEEVWKKDAEVLQEDLVKVDQFPVYPDSRTEVKFERDEAAQYLVAAALFSRPRGRSWFVSFEYPPAPAEGQCGTKGECEGDDCEKGPVLDPRFYIWVEGSRVEDGIEHADDYPKGRSRELEPPPQQTPQPAGAPAGQEGGPGQEGSQGPGAED
jgi:type VI secretion system protein VasD